jgi:hypothetical protein
MSREELNVNEARCGGPGCGNGICGGAYSQQSVREKTQGTTQRHTQERRYQTIASKFGEYVDSFIISVFGEIEPAG